jgi:serine/threonine protein kinase
VAQLISFFFDSSCGLLPENDENTKRYKESYPVIVMELIKGKSLMAYVKDDVLKNEQSNFAKKIFKSIMISLKTIHKLHCLHRDLKMDNVMVVPDEAGNITVKIIDFGHMVRLAEGQSLYRDSKAVGTIGFIAPESWRRGEYSEKSDVWQAGCILYWFVSMLNILTWLADFHFQDAIFERTI